MLQTVPISRRRVFGRVAVHSLVMALLTGAGSSGLAHAKIAPDHLEIEPDIYQISPYRVLDFSPYQPALDEMTPEVMSRLDPLVLERSIEDLQHSMQAGELTSIELTLYYLQRIREYDTGRLNAVIDLNPHALEEAQGLDYFRSRGNVSGPLHGIPVLIKDTIATGSYLYTAAGAAALANNTADRDAFLVRELKDAGAIILGKTNMSEWSHWMHNSAAMGYSAVGGTTISPYGEWIDPSGSSTGSAVAATMNLAALTVGTETMGSIISPASRASTVGMKPSIGTISRDYVIGLSDEIDSPGPIAKSVTDVAIGMNALAAARDPNDPRSEDAADLIGADFTSMLEGTAIEGKRVGLLAVVPEESDVANLAYYTNWGEIETLESLGAGVVVVRMSGYPPLDWTSLLNCDMHADVDRFLRESGAGLGSLADIANYNEAHPEVMPYGQNALWESLGCEMSDEDLDAFGSEVRTAFDLNLVAIFDDYQIDTLAFRDDANGGEYALAGWPAVTVPRGVTDDGTPTNLTFVGPYLSDRELLGYAYAFEQAQQGRIPPELAPAA